LSALRRPISGTVGDLASGHGGARGGSNLRKRPSPERLEKLRQLASDRAVAARLFWIII